MHVCTICCAFLQATEESARFFSTLPGTSHLVYVAKDVAHAMVHVTALVQTAEEAEAAATAGAEEEAAVAAEPEAEAAA